MDYEEKYKTALERARIWKDKSGMPKDKQGILDDIFPELAESENEDERIRKELIEHIKANCETSFVLFEKFSPDMILAWLEKQKPIDEKEWSEEDEKMFTKTLYFLDAGFNNFKCTDGISESKEWVKSLKQRIRKEIEL